MMHANTSHRKTRECVHAHTQTHARAPTCMHARTWASCIAAVQYGGSHEYNVKKTKNGNSLHGHKCGVPDMCLLDCMLYSKGQ